MEKAVWSLRLGLGARPSIPSFPVSFLRSHRAYSSTGASRVAERVAVGKDHHGPPLEANEREVARRESQTT